MFCTIADVKKLTGYDVDMPTINKAQAIIEVYCGRPEMDVDGLRDKALLGRAVAFQAAYIKENPEMVFEQAAVAQVGQNASIITYKAGDFTSPWIAPLAVIACRGLSWRKSRSVKTGRIFQRRSLRSWWTD